MSTSAKTAAQSEAPKADKSAPPLVLRGTQRDDKHPTGYDTTVLLFQAQGAKHLHGFVQVGGQKRQVIAHINERKPGEAGQTKPNYLRLVELDQATESWNVIGHGNAVNRRSDDKPIYFDEVLFNVEGETLRARVVNGVSDDLHRSIGFEQPRAPRPRDDDEKHSDTAPAPAVSDPTPSFAEFQATRRKVDDLANSSVDIAPEYFNGPTPGYLYDGDCYIECNADDTYTLTLFRDVETSNDLEALERKLYQWAVDERLFERPLREPVADARPRARTRG